MSQNGLCVQPTHTDTLILINLEKDLQVKFSVKWDYFHELYLTPAKECMDIDGYQPLRNVITLEEYRIIIYS